MNSNNIRKIVVMAKNASADLLKLDVGQRRSILLALARSIEVNSKKIISANEKDVKKAKAEQMSSSFIERLSFDENKLRSISSSIRQVAIARDNLFEILEERKRPSGIKIKKVRYPLGLLAIIYESRPNVTVDAFALSFKSGNAVIIKGGKEIIATNQELVKIVREVLKKFKISPDIIQDVSGIDRKISLALLKNNHIDCLIPRGGKNLIDFVKKNATVPIIETGASVVHTYVDESADLEMAEKVVVNAKTRRVSICNALDVLILHEKIYFKFLNLTKNDLAQNNIEIRADEKSFGALRKMGYLKLKKAAKEDFDTEFLDYILAIKVVRNFKDALTHIEAHSLGHSEAIVTKNKKQAEQFFREIDAACLYWNTSTQFSDGGEFGMGGEIGISTQKLHARGPFSHQKLTTYKYLIESKGATRT